MEAHLDFFEALFTSPDVTRWHWPDGAGGTDPAKLESPLVILESGVAKQARNGFSFWIWRERESGEPVARVGLGQVAIEGEDMIEVGWSVPSDQQGRGYASEAAAASIAWAFENLGLEEVVAFTMVENQASRRVMEKIGMTYSRDFQWAGLPHALYVAR